MEYNTKIFYYLIFHMVKERSYKFWRSFYQKNFVFDDYERLYLQI